MGMTKLFLVTISNGGTNYSLTAQALAEMTDEVVLTMGYVVGLLYAVAALLAIYNATVIYIKLQAGEGGFTKGRSNDAWSRDVPDRRNDCATGFLRLSLRLVGILPIRLDNTFLS